MIVGAQNRERGLKGQEGEKSESQGKRLCVKKERNKIMRGCRIRVRDGESVK